MGYLFGSALGTCTTHIQIKELIFYFYFSFSQDPIKNLAFEADLPKTYVNAGQQVIRFQAKVDKGTSLKYTFIVEGPDRYNQTFSTGTNNYHEYTTQALQQLPLGEY